MPAGMTIVCGGVLMAVAVALGAFGAHGLKDKLDAPRMETFQTAVHYQMYHAIGLVLIGVLATQRPSRLFDAAALLMLAGSFLFSGFLYAYVLTQNKLLAMPVPLGGLAFIAAWLALAAGAVGWNR